MLLVPFSSEFFRSKLRLRMSLLLCLCNMCELRYAYAYVFAYAYGQSWKTTAQVTDPRQETQAQGRAHSKRLFVRRKMTAVD